ncbi:hypothetical protein [Litoribrevibacter albus]|uniref:Uncharacterized protein n=1 Tax=Litoribrevibacter albus TaxID=1473156 RepID=A0AA37SD72_9GAMM|nr:hypothetical protein [Litoribrevibacter albus]GLQ32843.1 hypothetical protein GCM10007876_33220 [Litoribrevibacter albus]
MQASHIQTIKRYDEHRDDARVIAKTSLPPHLHSLQLKGIDSKALNASKAWERMEERKVDWNWSLATRYCQLYPKAFDLSVWSSDTLLSLTLGRPTYMGSSMRLDFIERRPKHCLHAGDLFSVSQLAYETYGRLIGASYIRIVEPMNQKLINYYTSKDGGFVLMPAKQGNPHYLVKPL